MIDFDRTRFVMTVEDTQVKLQPLSYRLLERLAETPQVCVSSEKLIQAVWGDVSVSADTLKQRVFVVRKQLSEHAINNISIEAVRGEGYRLMIEQVECPADHGPPLSRKWRWFGAIAVLPLSLIALISYAALSIPQSRPTEKVVYAAVNNRIVIWTNVSPQEMPAAAATVYEHWRSLLTDRNDLGELQLIYSARREDMLIPIQARKSRAALISYFEFVQHDHKPSIRLQIIEPTTAATLRSNVISYSDGEDYEAVMGEQVSGILNLLSSKKLYLQKEQRENAQSPIWLELRQIANSS